MKFLLVKKIKLMPKGKKLELKKMIGQRLKAIRSKKGLTQAELAEKTGISEKYLSSIERGMENPTINTIIELSNSLDADIGDIFYSLQVESPAQRKKRIRKFISTADDDQLKFIDKVLRFLQV